jgi:hypothetical protein
MMLKLNLSWQLLVTLALFNLSVLFAIHLPIMVD